VPDWLTVDAETIHVEANSSAPLGVTVAVPPDTPSGGWYASVAIQTGGTSEQENAPAVASELVVPFLITVEGEGDLVREATIEHFAGVLEMDGRLGFRAEINNGGNFHWEASGVADVATGDGDDYGNLEFQPRRVYPDRSILLVTTSTLPVEAGGAYAATTELNYGADEPVTAETEFTFTTDFTVTGSICENLDRGPTIFSDIVNNGDLGIMFGTRITIASADGQPLGQSNPGEPQVAWPNETSTSFADLPQRLPSGDYVLTVEAVTGTGEPVVAEIPFSIGGTGPNVAPICPQPESTPDTD
jgi:hypothetical protein